MGSMTIVFSLDKVADANEGFIKKYCRDFMSSFGVCIGFAWERAFDATIGSLVKAKAAIYGPGGTAVLRVIVSFAVLVLVVPAWRFYILPEVVAIGIAEEVEEEEEEKEKEKKESRHGQEGKEVELVSYGDINSGPQ